MQIHPWPRVQNTDDSLSWTVYASDLVMAQYGSETLNKPMLASQGAGCDPACSTILCHWDLVDRWQVAAILKQACTLSMYTRLSAGVSSYEKNQSAAQTTSIPVLV